MVGVALGYLMPNPSTPFGPLDISICLVVSIIGLFAGCTGGFGAAGHGWMSSTAGAGVMLFAGPLAGLGWLRRRDPVGLILSSIAVLECVAADITLVGLTASEGWGYAKEAFDRYPTRFIVWLSFWGVIHVVASAILSVAVWHRYRIPPTTPN